jgi:hypothetical protein
VIQDEREPLGGAGGGGVNGSRRRLWKLLTRKQVWSGYVPSPLLDIDIAHVSTESDVVWSSGVCCISYHDSWAGPLFPNASTAEAPFPFGGFDCGETGCLFDLESDPSEKDDLAEDYPEKIEELRAMMQVRREKTIQFALKTL